MLTPEKKAHIQMFVQEALNRDVSKNSLVSFKLRQFILDNSKDYSEIETEFLKSYFKERQNQNILIAQLADTTEPLQKLLYGYGSEEDKKSVISLIESDRSLRSNIVTLICNEQNMYIQAIYLEQLLDKNNLLCKVFDETSSFFWESASRDKARELMSQNWLTMKSCFKKELELSKELECRLNFETEEIEEYESVRDAIHQINKYLPLGFSKISIVKDLIRAFSALLNGMKSLKNQNIYAVLKESIFFAQHPNNFQETSHPLVPIHGVAFVMGYLLDVQIPLGDSLELKVLIESRNNLLKVFNEILLIISASECSVILMQLLVGYDVVTTAQGYHQGTELWRPPAEYLQHGVSFYTASTSSDWDSNSSVEKNTLKYINGLYLLGKTQSEIAINVFIPKEYHTQLMKRLYQIMEIQWHSEKTLIRGSWGRCVDNVLNNTLHPIYQFLSQNAGQNLLNMWKIQKDYRNYHANTSKNILSFENLPQMPEALQQIKEPLLKLIFALPDYAAFSVNNFAEYKKYKTVLVQWMKELPSPWKFHALLALHDPKHPLRKYFDKTSEQSYRVNGASRAGTLEALWEEAQKIQLAYEPGQVVSKDSSNFHITLSGNRSSMYGCNHLNKPQTDNDESYAPCSAVGNASL